MNYRREIKKYVDNTFGRFGVNKKNQVARLLYEISKRDGRHFRLIAEKLPVKEGSYTFEKVKNILLKARYPDSFKKGIEKDRIYLPKLDSSSGQKADLGRGKYAPSKIYFEKDTAGSELFKNVKKVFPQAEFREIKLLKSYQKDSETGIKTYNRRRDSLFIVNEKYDFLKACPCTAGCLCCNYVILNMGFGCPYECTYCYLQSYTNAPGITLSANLDDFFRKVEENSEKLSGQRIGSGEFADSLALDYIAGYSKPIIEFFKDYPDIIFEFKTKSDNIDNILRTAPAENIVISWSLNPPNFIRENEFYSVSLARRLEAASKCARAGYPVGFHFDPVVDYPGYEKDYREVVDLIFDSVNPEKIRWISVGTFRFPRGLKRTVEKRFPESQVMDGELLIGFDGKLRYVKEKRIEIYKMMKNYIQKKSKKPYIYLCMEPVEVWKEAGLKPTWRWE
ncbi:MAG: hypothetical protein U9R36_03770 [Elusimicrobiota bacterium]|nr:hypothetical protein [Elusimicrobiota bacterium]